MRNGATRGSGKLIALAFILLLSPVLGVSSSYEWVRPPSITTTITQSNGTLDKNLSGEYVFNAALTTDVPITILQKAAHTGDPIQVLDSAGKECIVWRASNGLIINPSGDCNTASTSTNYIRMYAPDAGFTGNYLLLESNSGVDRFRVDSSGNIVFGSDSWQIGDSSGSMLLKKNTAGQGMQFSLQNGDGVGTNFVGIDSGTFTTFEMVSGAAKDISMFQEASSGETPTFSIGGNKVGTLAYLNMTVGLNATGTATFYGLNLDNFEFIGNLTAKDYLYGSLGYSGDAMSQVRSMRLSSTTASGWGEVDKSTYGDAKYTDTIQAPITEKRTVMECSEINPNDCKMIEKDVIIGSYDINIEKISLIKQVALLTRAVQQLENRIKILESKNAAT